MQALKVWLRVSPVLWIRLYGKVGVRRDGWVDGPETQGHVERRSQLSCTSWVHVS